MAQSPEYSNEAGGLFNVAFSKPSNCCIDFFSHPVPPPASGKVHASAENLQSAWVVQHAAHEHLWFVQVKPGEQAPHSLPQPSSPHSHPWARQSDGVQHCPSVVQTCPAAHVPHVPWHVSSPHVLPAHFFWQHTNNTGSQICWAAQGAPHVPPQPSPPHDLPLQLGVQHAFWKHISPPGQVPQTPPQPSSPHANGTPSGLWQTFGQHWLLKQISSLPESHWDESMQQPGVDIIEQSPVAGSHVFLEQMLSPAGSQVILEASSSLQT